MGGFFGLSGTITINDVWFVHERGFRVGLWNMAGIASINIAPIISGYLIVGLGWRWSFWILAISFGVLFVFVVFFMPETSFDRSHLGVGSNAASFETTALHDGLEDTEKAPVPTNVDRDLGFTTITQPTWKRVLGLSNFQIKGQKLIFTNLVTPFLLLRAPAVVWSCAMWSVCFTWLIIQASVAQQIFGSAPYNMDSINVGIFIGCAPLSGAILGTIFAGVASDWIAKTMAIRNKGIYEPEFRLVIMIPFLITWCIGIFGLGASLSNELSKIGQFKPPPFIYPKSKHSQLTLVN